MQTPNALSSFDRESFQIFRNQIQEASEKAFEIEVIGDNAMENEKDKLVKEEMNEIIEAYEKKKRDFNMEQQISKSKRINDCRVEKMNNRNNFIQKLIQETKTKLENEICQKDNKSYKSLMRDLILQSMIKLMEDTVVLIVREEDKDFVSSLLKECEEKYSKLMEENTKKKYITKLDINPQRSLSGEEALFI